MSYTEYLYWIAMGMWSIGKDGHVDVYGRSWHAATHEGVRHPDETDDYEYDF